MSKAEGSARLALKPSDCGAERTRLNYDDGSNITITGSWHHHTGSGNREGDTRDAALSGRNVLARLRGCEAQPASGSGWQRLRFRHPAVPCESNNQKPCREPVQKELQLPCFYLSHWAMLPVSLDAHTHHSGFAHIVFDRPELR
jgi:hypothetical protein